jgi:hypothetical protein
LLASAENTVSRQARLTFAICRHTVVDLAQLFNAPPRRPAADRLPPAELNRLAAVLAQTGYQIRDDEVLVTKLTKLREMYEPYLQALSDFLYMDVPPWILAQEITDNWRTSAWGRISGIDAPPYRGRDDHID